MRSLINALTRAATAAERTAAKQFAGSGLSAMQYEMLAAIVAKPGITGVDLREAMPGYLRGRFSADCMTLEREKLIIRKFVPGDARQRAYWPTERGKSKAAALASKFEDAETTVGLALRHVKPGTLYDALTTIAANTGGDDAAAK